MTTTERIEPFTYYENEQGDFTVAYKVNSTAEAPVAVVRSRLQAKLACMNLNNVLQIEIASVIGKERPKIDLNEVELLVEVFAEVHGGKTETIESYWRKKIGYTLEDLTPKTDTTDGEY